MQHMQQRDRRIRGHGGESCASSKVPTVTWPSLNFPPLNLYSIWPTKEMAAIHAEQQDPRLWEDYT